MVFSKFSSASASASAGKNSASLTNECESTRNPFFLHFLIKILIFFLHFSLFRCIFFVGRSNSPFRFHGQSNWPS